MCRLVSTFSFFYFQPSQNSEDVWPTRENRIKKKWNEYINLNSLFFNFTYRVGRVDHASEENIRHLTKIGKLVFLFVHTYKLQLFRLAG